MHVWLWLLQTENLDECQSRDEPDGNVLVGRVWQHKIACGQVADELRNIWDWDGLELRVVKRQMLEDRKVGKWPRPL